MEKQLYLSKDNKMLAGVCGGIGEYFHIDPTVVRVLFVLLFLVSRFLFFFIYIILWAIMPLHPDVY